MNWDEWWYNLSNFRQTTIKAKIEVSSKLEAPYNRIPLLKMLKLSIT